VASSAVSQAQYRFGSYVLDGARRQLLCNGVPTTLPWRCFDALVLLVEAEGAVVDRDALFRRLWPNVEVDETGLTKIVSQLRRSLAEGDSSVEYIETIPRLGYRLTVPVLVDREVAAGEPPPPASGSPARAARRIPGWTWIAAAAAITALALGGGRYAWERYRIADEAERHYQEGRRLRRAGGPDAVRGAVENYRLATKLAPGKADYFAALAQTLGGIAASDPGAAREAAERAVQLDPECGSCRAVLGFTLFQLFWEWPGAGEHLERAVALKPDDSGLRGYMAMYLSTQGRLEEALEHANEAVRLDPYFATGHYIRAQVLFFERRYEEAIGAASRSLAISEGNRGALDLRAIARLSAGQEKQALDDWAALLLLRDTSNLDSVYRSKGVHGVLGVFLDSTSTGKDRLGHSYRRAQWRAYLGDSPGALDELEAAFEFHHANLSYIAANPVFQGLRGEPRYQELLRKMRLTQVKEQRSTAQR
jgi:DNA-binding winged helix-turn-helix (wHTH) protein/tetratricopeptide (TPR) repeat protein